jgi:hypothetical protein
VLIGIAGLKGSGKDTFVRFLIEEAAVLGWSARAFSFAEPMKRFCAEVFDWSYDDLTGPSELRERPDPRYRRADGELLTPRFALQTLGTEWGRTCFPNVWVDLTIRLVERSKADLAVITDCRFENEARAIQQAGGQIAYIDRLGLDVAPHPSETEQLGSAFQSMCVRISNAGTLDDLRRAAQELL